MLIGEEPQEEGDGLFDPRKIGGITHCLVETGGGKSARLPCELDRSNKKFATVVAPIAVKAEQNAIYCPPQE